MLKLRIIKQADISKTQLNEIIWIKSISWPFSHKKQLDWINNNLNNSDIHMLLLNNNQLVAYLNLINIKFLIDNKLYNGLGVGNVCASEKGKGYGSEVMKQTNDYILNRDRIGLLFCKKELVNFYRNNNWRSISKRRLKVNFNIDTINVMIYNYDFSFKQLVFPGKLF